MRKLFPEHFLLQSFSSEHLFQLANCSIKALSVTFISFLLLPNAGRIVSPNNKHPPLLSVLNRNTSFDKRIIPVKTYLTGNFYTLPIYIYSCQGFGYIKDYQSNSEGEKIEDKRDQKKIKKHFKIRPRGGEPTFLPKQPEIQTIQRDANGNIFPLFSLKKSP